MKECPYLAKCKLLSFLGQGLLAAQSRDATRHHVGSLVKAWQQKTINGSISQLHHLNDFQYFI
jgi:hypothetical protein